MKYTKCFLLIICITFVFSNHNIQATTEEERILIISNLPWYFDIKINQNNVQVGFIPSNLYIKKTLNEKQPKEIKNIIEKFLEVTYDHVLYIDMNAFYQDVDMNTMNIYDHDISHLFKHLHKISNTVSIPMLFRYQKYISSDLTVMDYLAYYKLFKNKNTNFEYTYLNYIILDNVTIPLENVLYKGQNS